MKIVGISACPAGLAHTPMAAKALEKAGKKIGFDVKMEQQGSMGQVNAITKEEAQAIAQAHNCPNGITIEDLLTF